MLADRQTDAQTDRQADCNTPLPYGDGVITLITSNKASIDIRLRPGVAVPLVVAGWPTWPTTAKHDVIHKTGST